MIGHSSPNAPWLITAEPSFVFSCPLSLRIGSSVPRAVETRAMATAISACRTQSSRHESRENRCCHGAQSDPEQ
jgi:hypothetical protein